MLIKHTSPLETEVAITSRVSQGVKVVHCVDKTHLTTGN